MDKTIRIVGDINIPTIHLFDGLSEEEFEVYETKKDQIYTIIRREKNENN